MAFSFEDVKEEIRAMFYKVPEEYRSKEDTLVFKHSDDYLEIQYGRNEFMAARNFEAAFKQKVYSIRSKPLVEMTEFCIEKKAIFADCPPVRVGTPLIRFVSSLDQDLYRELYG